MPENSYITAIVILIILGLIAYGYWRARPAKKTATTQSYYGGGRSTSIPASPILNRGSNVNKATVRHLRDAPRRDDQRGNDYAYDPDILFIDAYTPPVFGNNPVHSGPHTNDNHPSSSHTHDSGSSYSDSSSSSDGGGSDGGGGSD